MTRNEERAVSLRAAIAERQGRMHSLLADEGEVRPHTMRALAIASLKSQIRDLELELSGLS